jgi:hypothetical protein
MASELEAEDAQIATVIVMRTDRETRAGGTAHLEHRRPDCASSQKANATSIPRRPQGAVMVTRIEPSSLGCLDDAEQERVNPALGQDERDRIEGPRMRVARLRHDEEADSKRQHRDRRLPR